MSFNCNLQITPDILVEWMAFAHIWEITGSNLDQKAGYPASGFVVFFQSLPASSKMLPKVTMN
jgi:hypothetical protein